MIAKLRNVHLSSVALGKSFSPDPDKPNDSSQTPGLAHGHTDIQYRQTQGIV